jgi:formylglycine-generating enzyme required for sulfatase activity
MAGMRFRRIGAVALVFGLLAPGRGAAQPGQQLEDDPLLAAMVGTLLLHNSAMVAGLFLDPTASFFAEVSGFGASLVLKGYRPLLVAPPDVGPLLPNRPDQCGYSFVLPRARSELENFLGIVTVRKPILPFRTWWGADDPGGIHYLNVEAIRACLAAELPEGPDTELGDQDLRNLRTRCNLPANNWGVLGPPARAWAANTEVRVSVAGPGILPTETPQVVDLPAGVHRLYWLAENRLNVLGDLVVPPALIAVFLFAERYAARHAPDAARAAGSGGLTQEAIEATGEVTAEAAAKASAWKQELLKFVGQYALEVGLGEGAEMLTESRTTNSTEREQSIAVYDVFPPFVSTAVEEFQFEAADFGGTRTGRTLRQLEEALTLGDACGRTPRVSNDLPDFLPLGETVVTWRVEDLGPNPDDGRDYFAEAVQRIVVADTQPPLLLAPPSRVLETDAEELVRAEVDIGFAVAIDLADPQPTITETSPASFPRDSRTVVTWTATDESLNQAEATQWITIKTTGTNTAPIAASKAAPTLTSEPVDIVLTGSDPDFLDGRFDPLWFSIVERPDHGEFVAPLFPFFIEDLRTNPTGGFGPAFASNPFGFISQNYCSPRLTPPRNFVYQPSFVHVTDEGDRYVLDHFFICNSNDAELRQRISWWGRDGAFLGQERLDQDDLTNESFVVDRDGFLYYITVLEPGSSSAEINLTRCRPELSDTGSNCPTLWNFRNSSAPGIDIRNAAYARIDSERGIVYLTDQRNVYAFSTASGRPYLGVFAATDEQGLPIGQLLAGPCSISRVPSNGGFGMEVDGEGNLYVADSCGHRIHKFSAPSVDEEGQIEIGAHAGWLGRCTGSTNLACDDERERSKGFSCTDATCTVAGPRSGPRQGQLHHPLFLALDPNDVLYVADFDNFRVQRFAPDGTFAGEAISEGTGINKGERPSFVIGNMDRPRAVSVNASQFFVVDRDEQFLHIFGTLPFKDITDDSATVTYVSRTDFHSADDHFSYRVNDGLADSTPATVTISVARNFRPPVALGATRETNQETPLSLTLEGSDPDGILGIDFNGLDTLTFAIVSGPEHGVLTGDGAAWTYTPDPGLRGTDRFEFTVDDGVFTSNPAPMEIRVLRVNQPPVVTPLPPVRVGVGFPMPLLAIIEDDPAAFTTHLAWGDGTIDGNGGLVVDEETGEAALQGVLVTASQVEGGLHRALASHTYTTLGPKPLVLCVTDDELAQGCGALHILVEHLVNLVLAAEASEAEVWDDAPFQYAIQVLNGVPSIGEGLAAQDVQLVARVPAELSVLGASTSAGTCSIQAQVVECTLGTLANGAAAEITLAVQGRSNLPDDAVIGLDVEVSTTSPALAEPVQTRVLHDLLADVTDTDGDGIADRLDNCPIPNPLQQDSSGDGIGDACDCRLAPGPSCVNPGLRLAPIALGGGAPGVPNPADANGRGAVAYAYGISITEVTNADYHEFLVSVASISDPAGLYHPEMASSAQGGIVRAGEEGAYAYRIKPRMANKPASFVSWLDAARYVNWLENGRPVGVQSVATTERGAFDLTVGAPGVAATRNPLARWSLPSEDEWYKAAYYAFDVLPRYFPYPSGSDVEPRPLVANNLGDGVEGELNYADGSAGRPERVMTVASGEPGSQSPSGTWDQGGNVAEWLAADAEGGQRLARGGSFRRGVSALQSSPAPERSEMLFDPSHQVDDLGFRVVRIPEPALAAVQLAAALALLGLRRKRGSSR